mmetsp:Transcript_48339/g.124778  ORF Transcript_48339/g.124778 Transcript_48339/m.124778 type:complete len:226 (-) Transcript_48339:1411-2088(-)
MSMLASLSCTTERSRALQSGLTVCKTCLSESALVAPFTASDDSFAIAIANDGRVLAFGFGSSSIAPAFKASDDSFAIAIAIDGRALAWLRSLHVSAGSESRSMRLFSAASSSARTVSKVSTIELKPRVRGAAPDDRPTGFCCGLLRAAISAGVFLGFAARVAVASPSFASFFASSSFFFGFLISSWHASTRLSASTTPSLWSSCSKNILASSAISNASLPWQSTM